MPRIRKRSPRRQICLTLLVTLSGCAPRPPVQDALPAAGRGVLMLGTWAIWATTGGGPALEITVDSAAGDRYIAHVTHAFAGDVGEDLSVFAPIDGTVAADSTTRILIERRGFATPAWDMTVRPVGDSLAVLRYVWEGEDQGRLGRVWVGRRRE